MDKTSNRIKTVLYHNETFELSESEKQNVDTDTCTTSTENVDTLKPIILMWKNLRYEVDQWTISNYRQLKKRKTIIKQLNGTIRQNSLNALLGPSGAGKTSLINCLIGNVSYDNLMPDTEIYLNQTIIEKQKSNDSLLVGFVPQLVHETIFGQFTVEEILYYAFCFKNPFSKRYLAKKYIESIIEDFMLQPRVLKTKFEKCSGGEQRRVAVAQELMSIDSKPTFLFVDEPTTGLDSEAALLVIKCFQRLCIQSNLTIIASIHSPSSDILNMFDQLYIMAKGGVCIYSDHPSKLNFNLKQILDTEIDLDKPPIEEYLRIASNGMDNEEVRKLANETLTKEHRLWTSEEAVKKQHLQYLPKRIIRLRKSFQFFDFLTQLQRLMRLSLFVNIRMLGVILLSNLIFISLIGFVTNTNKVLPTGCYPYDWKQYNQTCQQELNDGLEMGTYMIYQLVLIMLLMATGIGFNAIMLDDLFKVFRNEHQNGWYSLATFFWSFQIVHLIKFTVIALHITLVHYLTGGYLLVDYSFNWNRFGHFLLFNWLLMIYMQSYGHLCGTIFMGNVQIMTVCSQLFYANLYVMNGLSVTLEIMNKPFILSLSHFLAFRYIIDGLLYSFYGIERCNESQEYSEILKKLYINNDNIYWNIIPALVNIIAVRLFTFLLLYCRFNFNFISNIINYFKNCFFINNEVTSRSKQVSPFILSKPIPIEYNNNNDDHNSTNSDKASITVQSPTNQIESTIEFKEFYQNRYIIGWRSLTLFATSSIFETRPAPDNNHFNGQKLILRNLSGQFRFGTINALLGTSGSGKTSLLKVLNGRMKTKLSESTRFYLTKYVTIRTCFITQEISGHLLPGLTAKQSLIYASKLKNCHEKMINHERLALKLLDELNLLDTKNTMVQNCSDGQRKRLALALELTSVHMPNLICIDEPTSGLDSNSAQIVINCLKKLVLRHQDITIVASVHQPNTELLMMFDQCYVLARDGICIYSGQPGGIRHFITSQIPDAMDNSRFPIEILIKYSCTGNDNIIVQQLAQETQSQINDTNANLLMDTIPFLDGVAFNRNKFHLKSIIILAQRYGIYIIRNQLKEWLIFLLTYICIGLSVICLFDKSISLPDGCMSLEDDFLSICVNKTDNKWLEENRIKNNLYYIGVVLLVICLAISMQTLFTFTNELKYFLNEHGNGWYSTGVFYVNKFIYETIPLIPIVMTYVFIVNIYDSVPINNHFYYWQVWIIILSLISFQAISHIVSIITNGHFMMMILTLAFFIVSFLILSNMFNPISTMNYFLKSISNLSVLRFFNQATLWLIYGGSRCKENEIQTILYQLKIPNTTENFFRSIIMLIMLAILYHGIALALLILKANPKANRRRRVERIQRYRIEKLKIIEHKYPSIESQKNDLNAVEKIFCTGNLNKYEKSRCDHNS